MRVFSILSALTAVTVLSACGTASVSDTASMASEFGATCGAPYSVHCGRFDNVNRVWSLAPIHDNNGPYAIVATDAMLDSVAKVVNATNGGPKPFALVCGKINGKSFHMGSARVVLDQPSCPRNMR